MDAMKVTGHIWTVGCRVRSGLMPPEPPPAQPWSTEIEDPAVGPVRLTGSLHPVEGSRALAVMIHGLGGDAGSPYMTRASQVATTWGLNVLCLNLRGADRQGNDFYHAGLIEDLDAALASPELDEFDEIYLLGFSLGGHTVLRWAVEGTEARVRAVAAVCPPLDLALSSRAFTETLMWVYRRTVLRGLVEIYEAVAARRRVGLPVSEVRKIRSLREWDERVIAPRHGFEDADDYYQRVSVGQHLCRVDIPALVVACERDPMVPAETLRPSLPTASSTVVVAWTPRGGHVAFPPSLDLGFGEAHGLEGQVMSWFHRQAEIALGI